MIPENDKYAMDMSPVNIIVIPSPFSPEGIFEYPSLKRIAAIVIIAKANPAPELTPKTDDSKNVYSLDDMKSDAPKIEQLTAMRGRNIPKL